MTDPVTKKKTRIETQFGFGGFVGRDRTESQMLARQRFLNVLQVENPNVLGNLFRIVLPAYQEVCFTEPFLDAVTDLKPEQAIKFIQSGGGVAESDWRAIDTAPERGYTDLAPLRDK